MFADHSRVSGGQNFGSFRAYITVTYPFRTRETNQSRDVAEAFAKGVKLGLVRMLIKTITFNQFQWLNSCSCRCCKK